MVAQEARDKTQDARGAGLAPAFLHLASREQLTREDLRRLREAHLAAQRAELIGQLAQQRLAALVLELEWQYGLLGLDGTVNIQTGRIERKGPTYAGSEVSEQPS